jgi:glycosyltransferase involved in cell wall biosynthesis
VVEVAFAIPGDLAAPTGGYAYARRMIELLPSHGIAVRHVQLPGSFPNPTEADLDETARRLGETDTAGVGVFLIDGLAYGAFPEELPASLRRPIVALVHHPLSLETGLREERRDELYQSERAALSHARWVIATSATTARILAEGFDVPGNQITIAEPGTHPAQRARGSGSPVNILAVGAVSPRKGFDLLVGALSDMTDLDWRLTIAGALDRDPEAAARLHAVIAASGASDRITLTGARPEAELAALYDRADLFVSAALFEGYGMVLAEAMARGLPLLASDGGAAAATVPDAAGLKVPAGDVAALKAGLRRMIGDAKLRRRFAEGSWAAGQALPRWTETAARVAEVLTEAPR